MSAFWTDAAVRAALGLSAATPGAEGVAYTAVGTDTRTLVPGSLFVALRGERFDAHDFLVAAEEAGARGAVVERIPEGAPAGLIYYLVPDTLAALGMLAHHYRRHLNARVVAIVGSNGKTTTKELTRAVLSGRYRVHATSGNLNNLVGVPLTLLAAPADAEALVVEVGTNAPGEVARLGGIVEPEAVIITSIAEEHLEGLGDLAGVLEEETSILRALAPTGIALVADEPEELSARARELAPRVRVAGCGAAADAELRASEVVVDEEGRPRFSWRGLPVQLTVRGRINTRNALLALGLAEEWGVPAEEAVARIRSAVAPALRSEVVRYGDLMVIADCYNANPASMEAAVELLMSLPRRGGRIAVLGSMRELGDASAELHRRVAGVVSEQGLDLIVATGEFATAFEPWAAALGERLLRLEDPIAAYERLAARMQGGEVVLLKGSRGVALERLLPLFERDFGGLARRGGAPGVVGAVVDRVTGE